MSEIQRLKALLPDELNTRVVIVRSTEVKQPLIATAKTGRDRYAVQIDLLRWQPLPLAQRDLLFWHEVARVQAGTVKTFPWELVVFSSGLMVSLIELVGQNLLQFSAALVVVGLAGNQLYQRNRGERSLREATTADQGAIALATKFGYTSSSAHGHLRDALDFFVRQTRQSSQKKQYEARLQVLAICAREHPLYEQKISLDFEYATQIKRRSEMMPGRAASKLF